MTTNHLFAVPTLTPEADLREIALLLARLVRALRSRRLERAAALMFDALNLLERQPSSEACHRASQLLEALARVGLMLEAPRRYYVKVPYSVRPTKWHPTTATGPFSVLTRGSFATAAEAHEWAERELAGEPYLVASEDAQAGAEVTL